MSLSQTFNQDASGDIGVSAFATTSAPSYSANTQAALSLTLAGLLRVDNSGVTQPISASSLPLPAGAATAALQTAANLTLSTISGQLPALLGPQSSANSLSVVFATGTVITVAGPISSTGTPASVSSSATSVTLLASNGSRKGYLIFNDSTQVLYVTFSGTSTTSLYSVKLYPNACCSSDLDYTGIISGIWASANGSAKVTEFT